MLSAGIRGFSCVLADKEVSFEEKQLGGQGDVLLGTCPVTPPTLAALSGEEFSDLGILRVFSLALHDLHPSYSLASFYNVSLLSGCGES